MKPFVTSLVLGLTLFSSSVLITDAVAQDDSVVIDTSVLPEATEPAPVPNPAPAAQPVDDIKSLFEADGVQNITENKEGFTEQKAEEPAPEENEFYIFNQREPMEEKQIAVLQSLDKITGRTERFEARVGETVKFGAVYVLPRACQKAPPIEPPESASFLQIWEIDPDNGPTWLYSNWMYASTPAISALDHPVYDIWVIDCKNDPSKASSEEKKEAAPVVPGAEIPDEMIPAEDVPTEEVAPEDTSIGEQPED